MSVATAAGARCARPAEHVVEVPGRTLRLPTARWTELEAEPGARTFRDGLVSARHSGGRVVTIVPRPMRDEERVGELISADEYLELSRSDPSVVVVALVADRDRYWVRSRERLNAPESRTRAAERALGVLTGEVFARTRDGLRGDIDETRYLLLTTF